MLHVEYHERVANGNKIVFKAKRVSGVQEVLRVAHERTSRNERELIRAGERLREAAVSVHYWTSKRSEDRLASAMAKWEKALARWQAAISLATGGKATVV